MISPPPRDQPVIFSQRLFQRLLTVYPQRHRIEYGPAMCQLFRDQARDAWQQARWWGLILLWTRVLPDLLKTSIAEHLTNIKGKKLMFRKLSIGVRSPSAVLITFSAVAIFVFLAVFGTVAIVTFLLPEAYASKARIKVDQSINNPAGPSGQSTIAVQPGPDLLPTEVAILQSDLILDPVIERLDLSEKWRKKYNMGGKLKTSEIRNLLKRMIEVRPARNTSLIDITVYSDDKSEAAQIANTVVEVYRAYREKFRQDLTLRAIHDVKEEKELLGRKVDPKESEILVADVVNRLSQLSQVSPSDMTRVVIIELAEPGFRPVRPNIPLNLFVGGLSAFLVALLLGGVSALIVSKLRHRLQKAAALTNQPASTRSV